MQRRVGYNEMFEQCSSRSSGHADYIYTRCCPYINGQAIKLLVYTLLHLVLASLNSPTSYLAPIPPKPFHDAILAQCVAVVT